MLVSGVQARLPSVRAPTPITPAPRSVSPNPPPCRGSAQGESLGEPPDGQDQQRAGEDFEAALQRERQPAGQRGELAQPDVQREHEGGLMRFGGELVIDQASRESSRPAAWPFVLGEVERHRPWRSRSRWSRPRRSTRSGARGVARAARSPVPRAAGARCPGRPTRAASARRLVPRRASRCSIPRPAPPSLGRLDVRSCWCRAESTGW